MNIVAFPKKLAEKLIAKEVEQVTLQFSGGSDEGHLNVEFTGENGSWIDSYNWAEAEEVEDWAWEKYEYNGAGDGSDYGDNIFYNFKEQTVSHEEWYTEVATGASSSDKLEMI